jgi:hypothetical protein
MGNTEPMGRRSFLTRGALAAATAGLAAAPATAQPKPVSPGPRVTGIPGKKVIAYYATADEILKEPKFIDALQKRLGVNVLLCTPPIKLPPYLLAKNPLGPDRTLCARAHTPDDSSVFQIVEETHKRGMDFWLYYTGHHYGEECRPICAETFDGVKFLDLPRVKYSREWAGTVCFSKPIVKEFEPEVFAYGAKTYGPDSLYVSHHRYINPSLWHNLFGCACPFCEREAAALGYDFPAMKKAMLNLRTRLRRLDRKTVEQASKSRLTLADFLTLLGEDDGVMDWIVFRAKLVGNQFKRINAAARTATNGRCGFISDTHNPTLSLYVGHNFSDFLDGASDAFHPLSWCDSQHVSAVAAWANQLCEWVPGLEEPTALKVVTRFFGWDDLGLPTDRIHKILGLSGPDAAFTPEAFYAYFNPSLTANLLTHEWTRLAVINGGRLPVHPVIKGDSWPEPVCRELIGRCDDLGFGHVFQRTDNLIDKSKL